MEYPKEIIERLIDQRKNGKWVQNQDQKDEDLFEIHLDDFHVIADWHHFAILSLMKTKDFKNNPTWIAKRLGISTLEAKAALLRLERLSLIKKHKKTNRLAPTHDRLKTPDGIASKALKKSHRQNIEQALTAIDHISLDSRDITSSTIATSPKKIKKAKEMIREFRRNLSQFLETGEKTEVFNINIQFYPLTKIQAKNEKRINPNES